MDSNIQQYEQRKKYPYGEYFIEVREIRSCTYRWVIFNQALEIQRRSHIKTTFDTANLAHAAAVKVIDLGLRRNSRLQL